MIVFNTQWKKQIPIVGALYFKYGKHKNLVYKMLITAVIVLIVIVEYYLKTQEHVFLTVLRACASFSAVELVNKIPCKVSFAILCSYTKKTNFLFKL